MKTQRQFSREFKLQVIREVESGIPVVQVARQHQIHPTLAHFQQLPKAGKSGIIRIVID